MEQILSIHLCVHVYVSVHASTCVFINVSYLGTTFQVLCTTMFVCPTPVAMWLHLAPSSPFLMNSCASDGVLNV